MPRKGLSNESSGHRRRRYIGKDSGHRAKGTSEVSPGPDLDPKTMAQKAKELAADWQYDVVSIGISALFPLVQMLIAMKSN